jgi:hypothetical protein
MSTPRKQKEIDAEIKALEGCKSYAPHYTRFGDDNHAKLDLQIEFLRFELDTTSGEFDELTDDEQSSVREAEDWMNGDSDEAPSSGWDINKPKAK